MKTIAWGIWDHLLEIQTSGGGKRFRLMGSVETKGIQVRNSALPLRLAFNQGLFLGVESLMS